VAGSADDPRRRRNREGLRQHHATSARRRWRKAAATRGLHLSLSRLDLDLAGRLLGTTDKVGFAGIDLARHGLVRLPAAERHGMLFVRPKPIQQARASRSNVDSGLGPLATDLAHSGWKTYPMFSADRINPRINWKFAIDTFLEGYHIPHLHRKTIAPYFIGNCGTFDGAGLPAACAWRGPRSSVRGVPEGERNYRPHVISIYQLFPIPS